MKMHAILRVIASIVIVAFVSTQCGFGTAYALRQEAPVEAGAGGIGKELDVPVDANPIGNRSRGPGIISSVLLGAGLLLSNTSPADSQSAQPTPLIESAEREKPAKAVKAPQKTKQDKSIPSGNRQVQKLIEQLASFDFIASWNARESLVKIGSPAVSYLLNALEKPHDVNAEVRIIDTLGSIGSSRAIPPLIDALKSQETEHDFTSSRTYYPISAAANRALVEIGAPAIPQLVKVLDDEVRNDFGSRDGYLFDAPRERLSERIFDVLDAIDSPDAKTYARIYRLIKEKNGTELSVMGEPAVSIAASIFQQLLLHPNIGTRHVYTEGGMSGHGWGDLASGPGKNPCLSTEAGDLRAEIAKELGNIGSPQSVDSLVAALSLKDYDIVYERNRYYDGVGGSVLDGTHKHTEVLYKVTVYVSTGDILEESTKALVKIGKPAVPALMEALNSKDKNVRFYAAVALGMIGDERVDKGLVKILKPPALSISFESTAKTKKQMSKEALASIKSRLTPEEWAAANKDTILTISLKVVGGFLAAVIPLYYILRKKLSRGTPDGGNNGSSDSNAGTLEQTDEVVGVSETTTEAGVVDEPTKAGAIGDIVLRGRLYRLTGAWGLDQVGVFKGASKEDTGKYIQSIKDSGKRMSRAQREAIRYGISFVATASQNFEDFQTYMARLENLAVQMQAQGNHWNLFNEIAEEALSHERVRLVYYPETQRAVGDSIDDPNDDPRLHFDHMSGSIARELNRIPAHIEVVPIEEITAGATGEGWWSTIVTRGRLWRLTGVWGLDQVGVFKGLSKEDMHKCIESIKTLRKNLPAEQRGIIEFGISPIARISRDIRDFQSCLSWFESLIEKSSLFTGRDRDHHYDNPFYYKVRGDKVYLTEATIEQALNVGAFIFSVNHPAEGYEEASRSDTVLAPIFITTKPAWTEEISIEVGRPAPILQAQLSENIAIMQSTITEKSGVVFTPGVGSLGVNVLVSQMNLPNRVLTADEMAQLNTAMPEAVDEKLQQIAAELKVDKIRLCKLVGEGISALNTEVVEIDPAHINDQIVEILKKFGITFDNTDPAKVEAARKALEAARALAIGV